MIRPPVWLDAAIVALRGGESATRIAAAIHVNTATVCLHLRRHLPAEEYEALKLAHRRMVGMGCVPAEVRERRAAMVAMYRATSATSSDIAVRFKVARSAVTKLLRAMLPPDEYRALRREKRAARMRGNRFGIGRKVSPTHLAKLRDRWGARNPNWRGDTATNDAGHARALRRFPLTGPCMRCPAPATLRHHRDENPRNNDPSNIEQLCRACHARHHLALRNARRVA